MLHYAIFIEVVYAFGTIFALTAEGTKALSCKVRLLQPTPFSIAIACSDYSKTSALIIFNSTIDNWPDVASCFLQM